MRISASVGPVTQSGGYTSGIYSGTWSWSLATTEVSADETKTVTITATDSKGASSRTSFSLTVKDVLSPQATPPANDKFANALSISGSMVSVGDTTEGATLEGGEPAPDPTSPIRG